LSSLRVNNNGGELLPPSTRGPRPQLEPVREAVERLKEVPGLSRTSAQILIAEIGTDMGNFRRLIILAGVLRRALTKALGSGV